MKAFSKVKVKSAKGHFSCFEEQLLDFEDDMLILDLVPPMELHLLLGLVNRLYDKLDEVLEKYERNVRAKDWSDQLNVTRREYHGGPIHWQ